MKETIKFYEDRIKHLETMLEKSMEMNKKLMDKIGNQPVTPTWNEPYTYKCPQCGISGINGYVCTNTACPTRVTCESK
jgi:rubrerythrin